MPPDERALEEGLGGNAGEHGTDPKAEPIPDGEHRCIPGSPSTTGDY